MEAKKIDYKKTSICIASCSSVIDVKRVDLIIDVMEHLDISYHWIHIGDGNRMDDCKGLAKRKLNSNNYTFLGNIDNNDVLKTYLEHDVDYFINMSDSEGVPVSIMEAISVGIPIIARNVGGIGEIVDEKNGLLIEKLNDYARINSFFHERIEKTDVYEQRSNECINKWKNEYNAKQNYTVFFNELSQT